MLGLLPLLAGQGERQAHHHALDAVLGHPFPVLDQGFVRVAACTIVTALADPRTNAATVLEQARACDAEGVRVAAFPELTLTGYSVEDLFLQEVVLDDPYVSRSLEAGAPVEFGHTLTQQIGGQIAAGFAIVGFYEDNWESGFPAPWFDGFIATRARKVR